MTIVTGGQTGVDRAALDFAILHGYPHGGWCPRGRVAEDGPIPSRYQLRETASADPGQRTEQNVICSDATLILTRDRTLSGGTRLTYRLAKQLGKPVLVIGENDLESDSAVRIAEWIRHYSVGTLNIAGPRESEAPGIAAFVSRILPLAFRQNSGGGG